MFRLTFKKRMKWATITPISRILAAAWLYGGMEPGDQSMTMTFKSPCTNASPTIFYENMETLDSNSMIQILMDVDKAFTWIHFCLPSSRYPWVIKKIRRDAFRLPSESLFPNSKFFHSNETLYPTKFFIRLEAKFSVSWLSNNSNFIQLNVKSRKIAVTDPKTF